MASNTVKFKLPPRSAIWNPCIMGFDGLSALGENPVIEAEVVEERNPELYAAVYRALATGNLILSSDNYPIRNAHKDEVITEDKGKKKIADELPSEESRAIKIMSEYNQEQLLTFIEKSNDANFLQILAELEMVGKNKTGTSRDKIKTAIKKKIRELDNPVS